MTDLFNDQPDEPIDDAFEASLDNQFEKLIFEKIFNGEKLKSLRKLDSKTLDELKFYITYEVNRRGFQGFGDEQ